jgi:hypothetical protein
MQQLQRCLHHLGVGRVARQLTLSLVCVWVSVAPGPRVWRHAAAAALPPPPRRWSSGEAVRLPPVRRCEPPLPPGPCPAPGDDAPATHTHHQAHHTRLDGRPLLSQNTPRDETALGFRFPKAPVESSRAWTPHRPREYGLAHPADTSRPNLATALALLSRWRLSKPKTLALLSHRVRGHRAPGT